MDDGHKNVCSVVDAIEEGLLFTLGPCPWNPSEERLT